MTHPDAAPLSAEEQIQQHRNNFASILEAERTKVADAVNALKKAIRQREWLRLGRGSYEWDDDRWRDEFSAAVEEVWEAIKPLEKIASDLKGCPKTWDDVVKARADKDAEIATLSATVAVLTEALEFSRRCLVKTKYLGMYEGGLGTPASKTVGDVIDAALSGKSALVYAQRLKDAANRAAINMVCDFAIKCGLATGHAETMAELLDELRPQIKEQTERMVAAETRLKDAEAALVAACTRERAHIAAADTANAGRMKWFNKCQAAEARALPAGTVAVCSAADCDMSGFSGGINCLRRVKDCPIRSAGVAS